ncbi:class I SAM-dependent methyltransferase [Thermomonospora umbrina]|uniref:Methyltransferase family protein n=1 Tax=Thermomonospora umbrina TaxID=111806 RepID=A0A3D9SHZ3_9ACTN|nr:class I SAM-dependent methyltransferase [Thermomonospora umbrina]REE95307.1 methyltransferase family protein [Thermomonospora umbrina]
MSTRNRARLAYKLRYAARRPRSIVPYTRRLARDTWLRLRTRDHVGYYRAVMRSDTARSADGAVGTPTHDRWLALGRMQFDYLADHGLRPEDRMLEIGCGNLRAGRLFIEHLDTGHYHGVDISPDILFAAQETLVRYGLQDKLPHLTPVRDLRLDFLPDGLFTVIHAHSVFSHSPLEVIDECLAHVGRLLAPDGFFDFTYNETEGAEHHVLREDFYYRAATLIARAEAHGLVARPMDDWRKTGHKQSKLRVARPGQGTVSP